MLGGWSIVFRKCLRYLQSRAYGCPRIRSALNNHRVVTVIVVVDDDPVKKKEKKKEKKKMLLSPV
jgi:hypothetical protein